MIVKVDYDLAKKNNMKVDAEKALKTFLNGGVGTCFVLFPQALNPFLKALENLCIWSKAVVVPAPANCYEESSKGKPAYIVIKISDTESGTISSLDVK